MGYAHIIVHNDLRERLKREQQWANQVMFVRERSFCEATHIAPVAARIWRTATAASKPSSSRVTPFASTQIGTRRRIPSRRLYSLVFGCRGDRNQQEFGVRRHRGLRRGSSTSLREDCVQSKRTACFPLSASATPSSPARGP